MPHIKTRDAVRLYYEETGSGTPIVFAHELAGDHRSWEPQMRFFGRRYRCIAFNARGYPPSDVPRAAAKYSQAIVADDVADLIRTLKLGKAHLVGSAMGSNTVLHAAIRHGRLAHSVTAINAGIGSDGEKRAQFEKDIETQAQRIERLGLERAFRDHRVGPARVQFQNKDSRGFEEFARRTIELSALGYANTFRGVLGKRPSLYSMEAALRGLEVPLLLVNGDEDDKCLEPGLFMKRVCPAAALAVVPWSGHLVNLEEPDFFNRLLLDFLTLVDGGRWRPRDPRSTHLSVLANKGRRLSRM
ncbi:MAG: alpha/beta fold hydrolase [Burkholderiales bacterium]